MTGTAATPQGSARRTLDQLTALRFVAAMAVLFSHLAFLATNRIKGVGAVYDMLFRQGGIGVSFFFVLSGFIISHVYRDRLVGGAIGVRQFLFRRLSRIMPLHWATALAFAAWLTVAKGEPPASSTLLLNLALLQSWAPDPLVHFSLNGPSWSLSDEMFFYLCFPVLALASSRLLGGAVATAVIVLGLLAAASSATTPGFSASAEWLFYVNPATRLVEFVTGVLLHRAYRAGAGRACAGTGFEVAASAAIVMAMLGAEPIGVPLAFRYQLAFLPVMAATVLIFAYGDGALSRRLRRPLPVLLGEASFALYLIHRPIVTFAAQTWADGGPGDVALAIALAIGSTLLAVATFVCFERPVLDRLRNGRRRASAPLRSHEA